MKIQSQNTDILAEAGVYSYDFEEAKSKFKSSLRRQNSSRVEVDPREGLDDLQNPQLLEQSRIVTGEPMEAWTERHLPQTELLKQEIALEGSDSLSERPYITL